MQVQAALNRDGTLSKSGCIFCSEKGSGDFTSNYEDIDMQIHSQKLLLSKKWKSNSYIAYFQNFTNTYVEISTTWKIYTTRIYQRMKLSVFHLPRADCLNDDVMDMLKDSNKKTLFLGVRSAKHT